MLIKYYLSEVGSRPAPGNHPCGLAYEHLYDTLYYSDGETNTIYRYEGGGKWSGIMKVPEIRTDLAFDGQSLWQIVGPPESEEGVGVRSLRQIIIDRDGGVPKYRFGKKVNLPEGFRACGLDFKGSQAYVYGNTGTIVVDVRKEVFHLPYLPALESPGGMILFDSEMWVADFKNGEIARIDSNHNIVDRIKVCETPTGITYGRGWLWVNNFSRKEIFRYEVKY